MLLEAAMAELRHDATPPRCDVSPAPRMPNIAEHSASACDSPLQPLSQTLRNVVEMKDMPAKERQSHFANADIASPHSNEDSSFFKDDHSKDSSSDEFSSSNAGSSKSTSFCDDASTNEGVSLVQEDNEFVNRVLHREPSNLGESSRFGSYRSSAAVAAGGVPFQWEAEPGKCKTPSTIKEEEEELVPPLSLPPIHLAPAHMPPYMSPSHSTTPSPRSLTGKVKSLINHVKKPSFDHFSFSGILETQKSTSTKSPRRGKKGRRNSSLSQSENASPSSTPYQSYITTFNSNGANVQRNEDVYAARASLNSSDPSSSPYYFSPLSNTSSYVGQGLISPRLSVAQSLSGSTPSVTQPHMTAIRGLHTSSRGSNSSISSISSGANAPTKAPAMLANCLLTLTAMSDHISPPSLTESGESDHQNGNNSVSFASPEMEILDEGILTSANFMMQSKNMRETTMAEFINRGGPLMNRSFSTSRVTFADDMYRRPVQKSKYYSAQLNNLAQPKSSTISPMKDSTHTSANLDVLFPLKRPNMGRNLTSKYVNQSDKSPDDRQAYADALDTSLDCTVTTDNEELNSMVQGIVKEQPTKERPAHEVVMQAIDENGYAYSPIASAFVFSPRKTSQNGAKHYFKPSTRANISTDIKDQHYNGINHSMDQPKSILKKAHSQELNCNVKGGGESVPRLSYMQQSKSMSHTGSQKISSVLLRFADAEEQVYKSKRHHLQNQNGMRAPACIQPVCSFLGRALLCRSKLASHARRFHS